MEEEIEKRKKIKYFYNMEQQPFSNRSHSTRRQLLREIPTTGCWSVGDWCCRMSRADWAATDGWWSLSCWWWTKTWRRAKRRAWSISCGRSQCCGQRTVWKKISFLVKDGLGNMRHKRNRGKYLFKLISSRVTNTAFWTGLFFFAFQYLVRLSFYRKNKKYIVLFFLNTINKFHFC